MQALVMKTNPREMWEVNSHFPYRVAHHVIGFSDLVDLWVKPMILCVHSTSRSREQRTKRR